MFRYLPRVSYEQFLRAISVSDLTVFPYPDNPFHRSKCSTRIIDYMTMAKPVVTTAVGMNLSISRMGRVGFWCQQEITPGSKRRWKINS